jgi:hypothetical protein
MKPGYDSRPSVPAATPNSDAVRLRMLEMTCGECEYTSRATRCDDTTERVSASVVVQMVLSYLVVVLHAGADYGIDSEFALFVERRCSHCVICTPMQRIGQSLNGGWIRGGLLLMSSADVLVRFVELDWYALRIYRSSSVGNWLSVQRVFVWMSSRGSCLLCH